MPSPAFVDQIVVDIPLRKGMNQRDRLESLDWTQYLSNVENLVYEDQGGLSKKPGPVGWNNTTTSKSYRLLNLDDGIGTIRDSALSGSGGLELYQLRESTDAAGRVQTYKGRITDFAITSSRTVGSWPSNDAKTCIVGVGTTDRYRIVLYKTTTNGLFNGSHILAFLDPNSKNIVFSYVFDRNDQHIRMVVVDNRYLHLYASYGSGAGATNYEFYPYDTEASFLNAGPNEPFPTVGWTALASSTQIVDAVAISGNSVVFQSGGAYQKFAATGNSVSSGTITGFSALTGVDTDGTNFYVVGYNATPEYVHKKVSSTFTTSSTALLAVSAGTQLRVAVHPTSSLSTVLAYVRSGSGSTWRPRIDVYTVNNLGTTFGAGRSLVNYAEQSLPFFFSNYILVALTKLNGSAESANASVFETIGQTVLVDLTTPVNNYNPQTYRPVASLGLYNNSVSHNDMDYGHFRTASLIHPQRPYASGSTVIVGTQNLVSAGSTAFDLHTLSHKDSTIGSGAADIFTGAVPFYTDGSRVQEVGWYDLPYVHVVSAGAGTVNAGVHTYTAVYEYKDNKGRSHYSRCSRPINITLAGAENVTVTVTIPTVTSRPMYFSPVSINLYRTAAGGTELRLVSKISVGTTGGTTTTVSYTDSTTDTNLALGAVLFRQPLLNNPQLDRYSPLAAQHICRNKDRVFYSNGSTVFYSSFDVDGEATWFNPVFFIPVQDGNGDITGLAAMDGVLVVFKRTSVFLIEGDGPPENGGTGTEFSPPRRIQTESGCNDARSIVATPDGIMYRSDRGIELLTRNFSVVPIGELVQNTVAACPYTSAAAFDRKNGRVVFLLGSGLSSGVVTGSQMVVYDTSAKTWAVWKGTIHDHLVDRDITAMCYGNITIAGTEYSTLLFSASTSTTAMIYYESLTDYTEQFTLTGFTNTGYVPGVIETGWVRFESMQDRIRVSDLMVLIKNSSNHNIKISAAYDYSGTYTDSETYRAEKYVGDELKTLTFPVPRQSVTSVRFKIEDLEPSDKGNYLVGTGKGAEFLAISVKLGKKGGGAKRSSVDKGANE